MRAPRPFQEEDMKRILSLTLLIVLVAASQIWAAPQFSISIMAKGESSNCSPAKFLIQGYSWATNGDDGSTLDMPISKAPNVPINVAAYKSNGQDGWNGANGFYTSDWRTTLAAGQTITEDIYVWATPDTSSENIVVSGSWSGDAGITYTLRLISIPDGITYNGPTQWTTSVNIILPFYSTSDGTTGYRFKVEITAAQ